MSGDMVWTLSAYVKLPGADAWELKTVKQAAPFDHKWTNEEVASALDLPGGAFVDDAYASYDYPVPAFRWPRMEEL